MSSSTSIFDRVAKERQRGRGLNDEFQYLRRTVAQRLVGRLLDTNRHFPKVLDVGCHTGHVLRAMVEEGLADRDTELAQCDFCADALAEGKRQNADLAKHFAKVEWHVAEEENLGTFCEAETYDLVTSSLALHWTNDLPLALFNARAVLKPDGCFVGALLGGHTLRELQASFAFAEEERTGGVSAHASPSARVADCGALLQQAGFNLITVDVDTLTVDYADPFVLLDDLQRMGEQHAPYDDRRRRNVPRDAFLAMASTYTHLYGHSLGDEGDFPHSIPATFDVIYMIGWAPADSQPKPLSRGTATAKIRDVISDSLSPSSPPRDDQ